MFEKENASKIEYSNKLINKCNTKAGNAKITSVCYIQGESKKSRPPTSFIDIFAWAQSFCIKFCTFIGSIYPCMCTDFRSFVLTFSEMALILLRAPIILWFQVSIVQQSVYSAKMQSTSLWEMMLLFSSSNVYVM